jgi:hypothetical protein
MTRHPKDVGNWVEGKDNHFELWVETDTEGRRLVATFENAKDLQRTINAIANTNLMIDTLEDEVIELKLQIKRASDD